MSSSSAKIHADTGLSSHKATAKADMFQDLLVYQDGSSASKQALEYASALSHAADGNVTALMMTVFNIYGAGYSVEATADLWLASREQTVIEAERLEKHLVERLAKVSPGSELRKIDVFGGEGPDRLAEFGRYADAIVLGWTSGGGDDWQRRLFNASLFHSGRPVIVVPDEFKRPSPPKRIMIAWSPSEEATRALHEALPLLRNAEAVSVIVVDTFLTQLEKDNPGVDIARHLARHDIKAEIKHVPLGSHGVTPTLLDESRYFGADMIVLGGYGHSRLSEWMLGGVTREILESCKLPMLFSH
jgi:nucleotide-binding universal stress UspA family protein